MSQAPPPWMRMFPQVQQPKPVYRPDAVMQPGVGQVPLGPPAYRPQPQQLPPPQPPRPQYPAPPAPPMPWQQPPNPMGYAPQYPQPQQQQPQAFHGPMGASMFAPQAQSQNAAVPPHACGVKLALRPEELDALLRGGPGSFVRINGINQCGSAVAIVVSYGDAPMANLGHAPSMSAPEHGYDPQFDGGGMPEQGE